MVSTDIEINRDKLKNRLALAGIAGSVLLAGVFYMFLIQAVVGIVALGVSAALGFTLVQLAPVFALKIANAKYRLTDAENVSHIKKVTAAASENPIETLTSLLQAKRKAFADFEKNVVNAAAARDTFRGKLERFAKSYPHRAEEFRKQYERMEQLVERKTQALKEAQVSLREGEFKLEEMKAYWEMSKDAIELNRVAGMDTGDAFEKLKADTACDAVFESMNRAFAELEVAAALSVDGRDDIPRIEKSGTVVFDVDVTSVEKVSVK